MPTLPISLCLFTSTKGHFGRKDDWRITLDHWNLQLPLSLFGACIAHLKTTPGDEQLAAEMTAGLQSFGFEVIETVADWSRGLSHGAAYLGDQTRVSADRRIHTQPYYLLLEDDSPVLAHGCSLEDLLLQSCQMLAKDHELLTVRVMRREDNRGPVMDHPQLEEAGRLFYSRDVNFQPLVGRTLDFYRLGMILEDNPISCQSVQCEALWRMILDQFSRSPYKHAVWEPDYAETVHIGLAEPYHTTQVLRLS